MELALEFDKDEKLQPVPGTLTEMYKKKSQADEQKLCEQFYHRFNQ